MGNQFRLFVGAAIVGFILFVTLVNSNLEPTPSKLHMLKAYESGDKSGESQASVDPHGT